MVLKRWSPDLTWQEVEFSSSTIWVQVHGLPTLWRTEENLRKVGSKVGSILDVDLIGDAGGAWRTFIRVRVEVDIDSPLIPSEFMPWPNKKDLWIGLKYEKVVDICYHCGVIRHDQNNCSFELFSLCTPTGKSLKAAGPLLRLESEEILEGVLEDLSNDTSSTSYQQGAATSEY